MMGQELAGTETMGKPQKTLDQLLVEALAKRQQAAARYAALEGRKKAQDLRERAKGEKLLLRLTLARLATDAAFKAALLDQLATAALKPEDHAAALLLLAAPSTEIAGKAENSAEGAIEKPALPK